MPQPTGCSQASTWPSRLSAPAAQQSWPACHDGSNSCSGCSRLKQSHMQQASAPLPAPAAYARGDVQQRRRQVRSYASQTRVLPALPSSFHLEVLLAEIGVCVAAIPDERPPATCCSSKRLRHPCGWCCRPARPASC